MAKVSPRRLRDAREHAGLTIAALARRMDVAESTVWRLEHDQRAPSADTLGRWARACLVSIEWLYEPDGPTGDAAE